MLGGRAGQGILAENWFAVISELASAGFASESLAQQTMAESHAGRFPFNLCLCRNTYDTCMTTPLTCVLICTKAVIYAPPVHIHMKKWRKRRKQRELKCQQEKGLTFALCISFFSCKNKFFSHTVHPDLSSPPSTSSRTSSASPVPYIYSPAPFPFRKIK